MQLKRINEINEKALSKGFIYMVAKINGTAQTGEWWISMSFRRKRTSYFCVPVVILFILITAAPVLACETPTPTPTPTPIPIPPFKCMEGEQSLKAADGETVGCVAVTNDQNFLFVKVYNATSVQLKKVSWAWSASQDGIPHDATGNPLPDQFPYSHEFTSSEPSYAFKGVDVNNVVLSDKGEIYLSAYAAFEKGGGKTCTWIASAGDGTETFTARNNPKLGPDVCGTPPLRSGKAVKSYTAPWTGTSLYLAGTRTPFSFTNGKWIWESYYVRNPYKGDIVDFTKSFTLSGTPVSATLWITADDG
jgi:hypothetical protein